MSDSFEFTLHSPLSKEDWDKLTDVELERTERIWFKTPSGKKIDYIPADVLDKIRAEIMQLDYDTESVDYDYNDMVQTEEIHTICREEVLQIIDKYKER